MLTDEQIAQELALLERAFRDGCAAFENKSHWASIDDLWEDYKDEITPGDKPQSERK